VEHFKENFVWVALFHENWWRVYSRFVVVTQFFRGGGGFSEWTRIFRRLDFVGGWIFEAGFFGGWIFWVRAGFTDLDFVGSWIF
jgi:hypothetical protein